jgi:hypothetical protein
VQRRFIEALQAVRIPRLRALGVITAETKTFLVRLGEVEQSVAVTLRKFPNQGSWSLFVCPRCGRHAQVLRLLDGAVVCRRCCISRGVRPRADTMTVRQRAILRIPKLRAMLESDKPLRLKPSTLWGKMERRSRLEAALRECEFRVAKVRSSRKKLEAIVDPCDEPDFEAPKRRWPRSKPKLFEPVDR